MFNLDGDKDKDPECVLERLEKGDQLRGAWLLTRAMDISVLKKIYSLRHITRGLVIFIKINVITTTMVAETIKLPSFAES